MGDVVVPRASVDLISVVRYDVPGVAAIRVSPGGLNLQSCLIFVGIILQFHTELFENSTRVRFYTTNQMSLDTNNATTSSTTNQTSTA